MTTTDCSNYILTSSFMTRCKVKYQRIGLSDQSHCLSLLVNLIFGSSTGCRSYTWTRWVRYLVRGRLSFLYLPDPSSIPTVVVDIVAVLIPALAPLVTSLSFASTILSKLILALTFVVVSFAFLNLAFAFGLTFALALAIIIACSFAFTVVSLLWTADSLCLWNPFLWHLCLLCLCSCLPSYLLSARGRPPWALLHLVLELSKCSIL